jgi:Ser/Thr protein kinase RdoA (MazF antagonist)
VPSVSGNILEEVESACGDKHFVRLLTYLEGEPLALKTERPSRLLRDLGRQLATIDRALFSFDDPAVHRDFHWDLKNGRTVVAEYVNLVIDPQLRTEISRFAIAFDRHTASFLPSLRQSVIYGDANDYNILVRTDAPAISGFIDFGDIVYSYMAADLAIAIAYVVLTTETPLQTAKHVVAGYQEVVRLEADEISVLWQLVLMRLSMSACIAAFQMRERPDNEYLDVSQSAILSSLPQLLRIDRESARLAFLNAT